MSAPKKKKEVSIEYGYYRATKGIIYYVNLNNKISDKTIDHIVKSSTDQLKNEQTIQSLVSDMKSRAESQGYQVVFTSLALRNRIYKEI